MYYFLNFSIFTKKKYFYGSGYPRIIEYRDGYLKSRYPETTNPDPDIKSTDPTDPDPDTLNFPDIRIRPRPTL